MNEPQILVRPGGLPDAAIIADFNRRMAAETESLDLDPDTVRAGVEALIRSPAHGFYQVATVASEIVGCLLVTSEWSDWRNGLFWWIQSVYVLPDYRRRGVYRQMYRRVQQSAAREHNVCGFRLYVERENVCAQEAYRNLGMIETHYRIFEQTLTNTSATRDATIPRPDTELR